jgi:hypothetical protein
MPGAAEEAKQVIEEESSDSEREEQVKQFKVSFCFMRYLMPAHPS